MGVTDPPGGAPTTPCEGTWECKVWNSDGTCLLWKCIEPISEPIPPHDYPPLPPVHDEIDIIRNAAPGAQFTYRILANGKVQFTNTTIGKYTSLLWNFGNGRTSKLVNPLCTYAAAGNYTVSLKAWNGSLYNEYSVVILVEILPEYVDFSYTKFGLNVAFTDISTITGVVRWDFGDNTYSDQEKPQKSYASAGDYTVRLIIDKYNIVSKIITVAPAVGFENVVWKDKVNTENLPNSNDLRKVHDSNDGWGDADARSTQVITSPINGAGIKFSIVNSNVGSIAIGLNNSNDSQSWYDILYGIVLNRSGSLWYANKGDTPSSYRMGIYPGEDDIFSMILDVGEDEYGSWIQLDIYLNTTYLYTFDLDESDFPLFIDTSFERPWDMIYNEQNEPIPNYLKNVQINTTGGDGEGGATDFPVAYFGVDVLSGPAPLTVHITDASSGSPTDYLYEFDDGTTETFASGDHTFTEAGIHTIRQTVSNALGASEPYEITVIAYEQNIVTPPDGGVIIDYVKTDEYYYAIDSVNHRILIYDLNWVYQGNFGGEYLVDPTDLLVKGSCILVVDRGSNNIRIFDLDGVLQSTYGNSSTFNAPFGIATNGVYVYVTDTGNNRILFFSFDETTCSIISYIGVINLTYAPYGIAFDDNFMYVIDKSGCLLNVYTLSGEFIKAYAITCGSEYVKIEDGTIIISGDDGTQDLPTNPDVQDPSEDDLFTLVIPNSITGKELHKLLLEMNVINAESANLLPLQLILNIKDYIRPMALGMNILPDVATEYAKNPQMPSHEVITDE